MFSYVSHITLLKTVNFKIKKKRRKEKKKRRKKKRRKEEDFKIMSLLLVCTILLTQWLHFE